MSGATAARLEAAAPTEPGPTRSSAPDPLRCEIVSSSVRLHELAPAWEALCDRAETGFLFSSPQWLLPWWDQFGEGRELCCVAVHQGEQLVGFWPLFSELAPLGGVPLRRVAFLGDGATGCDYLDLLAAPGREGEVLEAALAALGGLSWDVLDLDGMRRDAATLAELVRRLPPAGEAGSREVGLGSGPALRRDLELRFVCPRIPLGGTYAEYLAGLGRRENLRRREKWLQKLPAVKISCVRGGEELERALQVFFTLHKARWAGDGGSSGLPDPRFERFHADAVKRLAERDALRLYTLSVAERPVASVYGVVHGGKFLYYQSGYDPAWANKSVGMVLLAKTVEDAFAEGLTEFDFLRGDESYKFEWARAERWTVRLRIFRGSKAWRARQLGAAARGAKATVRKAVPESLWTAGQAVRRAVAGNRGQGFQAAARAAAQVLAEQFGGSSGSGRGAG